MMKKRKYLPIAAIAAVALVAAACSSSGDDQATVTPIPEPTPPTVHTVDLPEGHGLSAGTTSVAAGETEMTDAGTHITCAGMEDCEFTIAMDPVTGAITATSTGGMVSLTTEAGRHAATIAANKTTLADAQAALKAVQALYGAGDATKNELDAAEKAVADAMMLAGNEPVPEPVPDPVLVADLADDIGAAKVLVAALGDDASDGDIQAAKDAIETATDTLGEVENLSDDAKNAYELTIETIEDSLKIAETSIMTARKAADDANAKAMAAAGKALHAVLRSPISKDTTVSLEPARLTVDPDGADGTGSPAPLKAGDSAGSSGGWAGTHYAHKSAGTGVTSSAIVYTNRAAAKSYPITTRYAETSNWPAGTDDYFAATRTVKIKSKTPDSAIAGAMFPTAGSQNFANDPYSGLVVIPGTYQGASGSYRCTDGTSDTPCSASWDPKGIKLGDKGTWVFIHDVGAMVSVKDASYLYFGWWLQKDKDGEPTGANAFAGSVSVLGDGLNGTKVTSLTGSATYTGGAAGKFSINDPINGGDAGHFTADATLSAKFSGNGEGISGTLENFMANDNAVPWSVALHSASWSTADDGKFATPTDDVKNTAADERLGTTWSIDGNSAARSGSWSGTMYDEKTGNAPAGDGSDVPTSVTGVFQSQFGSTHTMVGAFGATKQ